ncbi:hypothetical protein [uncultured Gammaproteobacteria bacterium]|nr:hypothetical protein [uncultured Gammaproteobacteria bacterium]CAC9631710.1 hypothetical protein [uncultured Gammaproteobacteria bacterium]CAC9633455.1 hypothetical protein [uncultured Gammaproteobacteria bacterium]CAC9644371.1 hypothetical protein [uncultured Gammaproteobacteria bacterium]VVH52385.1 hypothetical protein BPUTSESOX_1126 [uncultured Gammaproteobacteria bacterium]
MNYHRLKLMSVTLALAELVVNAVVALKKNYCFWIVKAR